MEAPTSPELCRALQAPTVPNHIISTMASRPYSSTRPIFTRGSRAAAASTWQVHRFTTPFQEIHAKALSCAGSGLRGCQVSSDRAHLQALSGNSFPTRALPNNGVCFAGPCISQGIQTRPQEYPLSG